MKKRKKIVPRPDKCGCPFCLSYWNKSNFFSRYWNKWDRRKAKEEIEKEIKDEYFR